MTDSCVLKVQQATKDPIKREEFIEAYKPFIAAVVSKICGKYKNYGVDDELSIGLMAFNEAIDKYDGRGSFLSFAKLVIKSRLYDYFRYVKRRGETEALYKEDGRESQGIVDSSFDNCERDSQQEDLKEEILSFNKELSRYGITLSNLAKSGPKHGKKRIAVKEVINYMLSSKECMDYFNAGGNLPLKTLENELNISRKLIEPYRKYIIAVLVINKGNYTYLKEYLK